MNNPRTTALSNAGVSIWLDDLSRDRIESGDLAELIVEKNVVGVTTNPTIFANAVSDTRAYDDRLVADAQHTSDAEQAAFALMCADVADACDVFATVHRNSEGKDGWVSIEVSPELAHDTAATIEQALELYGRIDRPNVMIKIPATPAGLEAITAVTAAGISVNVTLIFSLARYRQVINAYLGGLELARTHGHDLSSIHSVASFFVSRLDTLVDAVLDDLGTDDALAMRGKAGLANARLAYEVFEQGFASERARLLLDLGANVQRPLWASTGVKDPAYPDTLYVTGLIAPQVVNTMPESTLLAFADHGNSPDDTITGEYRESDLVLNTLDNLGIEYEQVTAQLEAEGVEKFMASWHELLATVSQRLGLAP